MAIRLNFENELEELHLDVIKMGSMIETAIELSVEAFKTHDLELCAEIIEGDKSVDDMEKQIESRCLRLIVKEQPIALDLRRITTALKLITDMERIADNAADIAVLTRRMHGENLYQKSGHITQMSAIAISMVRDSVSAYVSDDLELARKTIARDDEVDELFNVVKRELVRVFKMSEDDIDNAIDFLMIAKYLERIADHAVNICEWVEFSKTGKHKDTKIF